MKFPEMVKTQPKYIEVMAAADSSVVKFHGKEKAEKYVLTLMNIVSKFLHIFSITFLRRQIYIINLVDKTKLCCYTPQIEHRSFFKNWSPYTKGGLLPTVVTTISTNWEEATIRESRLDLTRVPWLMITPAQDVERQLPTKAHFRTALTQRHPSRSSEAN